VADVDLTGVPNGDTISRAHARFTCDSGLWCIEILTDTNASFVDNHRVHRGERVPMRNGARVTLAETTFVFQSP
jgi:pSer/pThr/pTyr-binding forkhead associated (FHA) protein